MASIFEAKDYRSYIVNELESERFGRGSRAKLATHLQVQISFISLVLTGRQDFTLEHGLKVAEFLGLDLEEKNWLLLLMNRDRANSHELKTFFQNQINELKNRRSAIQNQFRAKNELSEQEIALYYGAWYHTAVHMCLRNPKLSQISQIANYLGITPEATKESIKLLESLGFVSTLKGKWTVHETRFHFGKKSPALRSHHTNWRQMAIRSLDEDHPDDLHYSALFSLDEESFKILRKKILSWIEEIEPTVQKAKDQQVAALNFDLFKVGRPS